MLGYKNVELMISTKKIIIITMIWIMPIAITLDILLNNLIPTILVLLLYILAILIAATIIVLNR